MEEDLKVFAWNNAYDGGFGALAIVIAKTKREAREILESKMANAYPAPLCSYDVMRGPDKTFELNGFAMTVEK